MKRLASALLFFAFVAACGGESEQPLAGPTVFVTVPATVAPAAPPPSVSPPTPAFVYPFPGYPKIVPLSDVPEQMRWSFDSADAVAVAPGVWAENAPGTTIMDNALHGAWAGYCGSIEAAERQMEHDSGSTCW